MKKKCSMSSVVVRTFTDFRTPPDPMNCMSGRNYNSRGVTYIGDDLYKELIAFLDKCLICRGENQEIICPYLHTDTCRLKKHPVESKNTENGFFRGRSSTETKRSKKRGNAFLMDVLHIVINHILHKEFGYTLLVRPGQDAGFQGHHKDKNPFNNFHSNAMLVFTSIGSFSHNYIHNKINSLHKDYHPLYYDYIAISEGGKRSAAVKAVWKRRGIDESYLKKCLQAKMDVLVKEMNNIATVKVSPDMLRLIDDIQNHVAKDIIWTPDWIMRKMVRYYKIDLNRFVKVLTECSGDREKRHLLSEIRQEINKIQNQIKYWEQQLSLPDIITNDKYLK